MEPPTTSMVKDNVDAAFFLKRRRVCSGMLVRVLVGMVMGACSRII